MPSQHRNPARAFRPESGEWDAAEEILKAREIVPGAFLRACLRWLASNPDDAFAALASHWPDARPLGRPRHQDPGSAGQRRPPADDSGG